MPVFYFRFLAKEWTWGLLLVSLIVLAYSPVWEAGFSWDDDVLLTANPVIVGPLGLKEIWTTARADICPLTLTVFWIEHALWGLAPRPYHLINVLLHALSAVLLWRILVRLCGPGAWIGAALWALHPVEVESVAAICEMKNALSGVFFLLSILFFIMWLNTSDYRKYVVSLICAALAMASKTSTVILPVVLCLCAWWFEGKWKWGDLMRFGPFFMMAIAASLLTVWTQGLQMTDADVYTVRPWPERLGTSGDVVWFYLGKLLWPHPLMLMYPLWEIQATDWRSYVPLLGVIGIFFLLWFYRLRWSRPSFFIFAYFLVCLFPVIGLMDQVWFWNSFVADHLQYLASMGPLALVGIGMVRLTKSLEPKAQWLQPCFCVGVLLLLGILTWQRTWAFEDRATLWNDTLAKNPNYWPAYIHVGFDLLQNGKVKEAIPVFEKALEINPESAKAHNELGVALAQTHEMAAATQHFRRAVEINPNFAEARSNLGLALVGAGQIDDAIIQFQEALKIDPANASSRVNLGTALLGKGRLDEAANEFREALKIKPDFQPAQIGLDEIQAMTQKPR